ncbi:MAG: hypothetical protein N4A57_15285 [Anaeromicrobium sp.]|jgi:hypothetical protein|uniref:hypothetical protein n=1 Tax=Anaeromicrobium sp. TaxID=1929132 RepID=UPI0025FDD3F1|nr:hypothetical protein [Anaeromicrobium sp.]MCT4595610.1 hypothetical protein [Anaeromicrobium sp.]
MYIRPLDFQNNYYKSQEVAKNKQTEVNKVTLEASYMAQEEQKETEIKAKRIDKSEKKDDVHMKNNDKEKERKKKKRDKEKRKKDNVGSNLDIKI